MRFVLKLLANLTDPHDGDVSDRIISVADPTDPSGALGMPHLCLTRPLSTSLATLNASPGHPIKYEERGRQHRARAVPADRAAVRAGLGFALFSVSIAPFTGPSATTRPSSTSTSAASSRRRQPVGPNRFPIKYFLTAMLFIIFDIEIIFLYPYAVANKSSGLFGLVEMILFIVTVFIAYAYVWRRGGGCGRQEAGTSWAD